MTAERTNDESTTEPPAEPKPATIREVLGQLATQRADRLTGRVFPWESQ
jgi:hypothetical protein